MQVGINELSLGVEVEFSGITRLQATQLLVEYFGTTYLKCGGWENDEFTVPDQKGRIWQIVKDNSVDAQRREGNTIIPASEEYKCELVTPILRYEDIPILLGVIESIKREGGITGANCGIHVHMGAELFNPKSLRVLCKSRLQQAIFTCKCSNRKRSP